MAPTKTAVFFSREAKHFVVIVTLILLSKKAKLKSVRAKVLF